MNSVTSIEDIARREPKLKNRLPVQDGCSCRTNSGECQMGFNMGFTAAAAFQRPRKHPMVTFHEIFKLRIFQRSHVGKIRATSGIQGSDRRSERPVGRRRTQSRRTKSLTSNLIINSKSFACLIIGQTN